jgi:hypothetical protein
LRVAALAWLVALAGCKDDITHGDRGSDRPEPAPADEAFAIVAPPTIGNDTAPDAMWTVAAGALAYHLTIATDPECADALQSFDLTDSVQRLDTLAEGDYYACVTALDADEQRMRAANDGYAFAIDTTPPGPFTIAGGGKLDLGAGALAWTAAADAQTYDVAIGATSCDDPVQSIADLRTTSWKPAGLAPGSYVVCVTARDVAGNTTTIQASFTVTAAKPDVVITAVAPALGWPGGGTLLTLTGSGFVAGATVRLGGDACGDVSVVSATELTCTAPAHAVGAVDVVVRKPDGHESTLKGGFGYALDGFSRLVHVAGGIGPGPVDGTGTAARLDGPMGLASDGTDLFFTDGYANLVRRFEVATGRVTTIAGHPGPAGSDDGVGPAAGFAHPYGIVAVGQNLYVADWQNHTVRKVVIATGSVSTVVGQAGVEGSSDGTGTAALLKNPTGLASDGTHLYIADGGNHTIRRLVLATGEVTTISGLAGAAGNADGAATARYDGPAGLLLDGATLYVADANNGVVRALDLDTGSAATLATGLAGPAGMASDGTYLYVGTPKGASVTRVTLADGTTSTLVDGVGSADGPLASAKVHSPYAVARLGTDLYVLDAGTDSLRRIDLGAGTVATVAGSDDPVRIVAGTGAAAQLHDLRGLVSDGTYVYAASHTLGVIVRTAIATGAAEVWVGAPGAAPTHLDGVGTDARLASPWGLASDGESLYVTEHDGHSVSKIDLTTAEVTRIAGGTGIGPDNGIGAGARFRYPAGIATDGTYLYVSEDLGTGTIRRIELATREVTTIAGSYLASGAKDDVGADARFASPASLTYLGGKVYVADTGNHTIRELDLATHAVTTVAGKAGSSGGAGTGDGTGADARFDLPAGLATDGASLYVTAPHQSTIRKIDLATHAVTTIAGAPYAAADVDGALPDARLSRPQGLVYDPVHGLFVAGAAGLHVLR